MSLANPDTIDLIVSDPKRAKLLLVMTEHRKQGGAKLRKQLHAKANTYASYAMREQFSDDHPSLTPNDVVVKLDCAHAPDVETLAFFREVADGLAEYGIGFEYEVCGWVQPNPA